jgi:hypothetical protein
MKITTLYGWNVIAQNEYNIQKTGINQNMKDYWASQYHFIIKLVTVEHSKHFSKVEI